MVQRTTDDAAALQGKVRDFVKRLKEVVERLSTDKQGANDRFDALFTDFSGTLSEYGVIEIRVTTNTLFIEDSEVFRSEARTNNLAFDLFRQGVRLLKFSPGLQSDELYGFVLRFSEFSSAEEIDEDLATALWRENLDHVEVVAVDSFTEKVFMADPEFIERFKHTIEDVFPGFSTYTESDEPQAIATTNLVELHVFDDLDKADLAQRKLRKQLTQDHASLQSYFQARTSRVDLANHLLQQICANALHSECPLQDAETMGIIARLMTVYVDEKDWMTLSMVMRSLFTLAQMREGASDHLAHRLERIGRLVGGRDALELLANALPSEETNLISWSRWFFLQAAILEAPQLLELVNSCQNPTGKELIKSLLRRQSASSMEAWAERLRDPNASIVEEVIDVIVESELGEQAKSLFLETLRHQGPSVRARSIEVLMPYYDQAIREAILPLITDPDERVRSSVLRLAMQKQDRSLVPYLAQVARSNDCYMYSEDELRTLYETVALLGDEKHRQLFEERLDLGSEQSVLGRMFKTKNKAIADTPMRRAALSGLAVLGDNKSIALIRKVHGLAELSLAAHCEVVIKMGARLREGLGKVVEEQQVTRQMDDVSIGADRMGNQLLFTADTFKLTFSQIRVEEDAGLAGTAPTTDQPLPSREATPKPIRQGDELYVVGDQFSKSRRLSGLPSVLTSSRYRLLDVQLALTSLNDSPSTPARSLSPASQPIVEKRRPARPAENLENIDELLKDYVDTDSVVSPQSVDDILQGYLGDGVPTNKTKTEKDLETLLMDYAEEDTEGSS